MRFFRYSWTPAFGITTHMDMEGNDLTTDNLALSDELSAPSVYSERKDTAYAKRKRVQGVAITLTSLLVVAGGAIGIGSINPFLKGLPRISESYYAYEDGALRANFTLENEGNYKAVFFLQAEKASSPLYRADISAPKEYSLVVEGLRSGVVYQGKWTVSNGFDYEQTESLFTINEKGEIS